MKLRLLMASLILIPSFFIAKNAPESTVYRRPQVHEPGLLVHDNVIPISQSDFDSGTLRIKESGYYYLTEDIVFDPDPTAEAGRTDKPVNTGWFTALSFEVDNIVFDLNTKTMEASKAFVEKQNAKVFSIIELNNGPFPLPTLNFAFTGETEYKTANNVLIKNGVLGRSSHHGIHGNNNTTVRIHNLIVKDWEVGGIALNGPHSCEIKHVHISGIENEVPFTGFFSLLHRLLEVLEQLKAGGDTGAQVHIDVVNAMLNDPSRNGTDHPSRLPDGNMFGVYINNSLDVGPLQAHCPPEDVPQEPKKIPADSVVLEDVSVANIKGMPLEVVGMADRSSGSVLRGPGGSLLRWEDAYPNGVFAPTDLLKAQVYGVNKTRPSSLPTGFANNILKSSPSESAFISQVRPHFEGDLRGHTMKGLFGIRVESSVGVVIKECHVYSMENIGPKGGELTTLPGGSNYSFKQDRHKGDDVYGISIADCHGYQIIETSIINCTSENGFVFGLNITGCTALNRVLNCNSSGHVGKLDNPSSRANPSSRVVGVYVENASNSNEFTNCLSNNLSSPRASYGFLVQDSEANTFRSCSSVGHQATSEQHLGSEAKYAVGFKSIGNNCMVFQNCEAKNMYCVGEKSRSSSSKSVAAGFVLQKRDSSHLDKYAVISDCVARCNNGGAGKGVGILLDGAYQADITKNVVATNHADVSAGKGYGIQDTASNSTSMILQNIAYGNATRNYSVNYTDSEQSLPVVTALYNNVSNLLMSGGWSNISLELPPGIEYTGNNARTTVTIRQTIG